MAAAPATSDRCFAGRTAYRAVALLVAARLLAASASTASLPRFKWGQNKDQIYLSVIVRDLDTGSVTASLPSAGEFRFRGKDTMGEEFALDLELREDVKNEKSLEWEIAARPDRWGTAVFCTLNKVNQHPWDLLVMNPKKYKSVMDKDWTREDQTLEPDEEIPYAEDDDNVMELTEKNKQKSIEKFKTLLVNVRYPWCSECTSEDEAFLKAAKDGKAKGKKDAKWKKVAFAVLDAREERRLAKEMGAKCDNTCQYRVFTGPKMEPSTLKAELNEIELLEQLEKYLVPAYQVLNAESEVEPLKEKSTTCLGRFASEADPEFIVFKRVAGLIRGELVFAAAFGMTGPLELWPHKQNFSFKFDGSLQDNGTALYDWIKPRSIPLLQEYDWQLRETYEKLGLPLAQIFLDDEDKNPSMDKTVRHAVRRVAKQFIGKIAFVELKKSSHSYELRDYGLNEPEVYPAFGIASSSSHDSAKYAFEVTSEVAESNGAFWANADTAVDKLVDFCEQVLAGTWPEAHESGAPQTTWTKGEVKHVVWKSYKDISAPEKPLLLQVYGKHRIDNDRNTMMLRHLASALEPMSDSLTVASYDTSDNYLPPQDFKRDKDASDTEWYWVPAKPPDAERPPIKKLMKPKKDAPIHTALEFAAKHIGASLSMEETMAKFEQLMEENPPPKKTETMAAITMDGMGGSGGDLGDMGNSGKFAGSGGGMKMQTMGSDPSEGSFDAGDVNLGEDSEDSPGKEEL